MIFQYELKDNSLRVMLPKELDHHSSIDIRTQTDMLLKTYQVKNLIFDFSQTEFMDSSGIGLILGRVQQVHPVEGKIYLFGGTPSIQKMWEMSGVLKLVTVLDTIEEVKEVYE